MDCRVGRLSVGNVKGVQAFESISQLVDATGKEFSEVKKACVWAGFIEGEACDERARLAHLRLMGVDGKYMFFGLYVCMFNF